METDDILEIIAKLDKAKVKLPTFVAANLSRIPSVLPEMADEATLTATVSIIKEEVEKLRKEMSSWKASNNNTKEIYPELHGEKSRVALPDRKTINSDSSTGAICRQERNAITYADSLKENHEGSWFQVVKSGKVVKDDTYKNHKIQPAIFGAKVNTGDENDSFAVKSCRTWHFKLGQLKKTVSKEQVDS